MAAQTAKSGLAAKYGPAAAQLVEKHKMDDVQLSNFGSLPPDINDGVARLEKVEFPQFEKGDGLVGEYYFRATFVALEPVRHRYNAERRKAPPGGKKYDPVWKDERVRGKQFSVGGPSFACCKTQYASQEENLAKILEQLKILLGDSVWRANPSLIEFANWEDTARRLSAAGPGGKTDVFVRYHTFQGAPSPEFPNPKVIIKLDERLPVCPPLTPEEGKYGDTDNGAAPPAQRPPAANGHAPVTPQSADDIDDPNAGASAGGGEEPDVAELLAAAKGDDSQAQATLRQLAIDAGHSEEDVDNAEDWDAVAAMIGGGEEEGEKPGPAQPTVPEVGVIYDLMVWDRGKKKELKKECECVSVNKRSKTMRVKDNTTKKEVVGKDGKVVDFPWDAILLD